MVESYVTLAELAAEWELDRSNTRKYVLKAGFAPIRVRTASSRNQPTLALSLEEAELVRAVREQQGFSVRGTAATSGGRVVDAEVGRFYIVQLVPELAGGRVKLGFTGEVQSRLQAHRTASPTACLVGEWPCRRAWEKTVMDSVTRAGCRLLANEVFECEDVAALVQKAETLFGLLPPPEYRVPLAAHSPLNGEGQA